MGGQWGDILVGCLLGCLTGFLLPGVKIYAPQTEIRNAFPPCVLVFFFFFWPAVNKAVPRPPSLTKKKKEKNGHPVRWCWWCCWPMAISCCCSPFSRRQVHFISAFHFAPSKPPSVLLWRIFPSFFSLPSSARAIWHKCVH